MVGGAAVTERTPTHVDDPGAWLGSQLEHPAESAGTQPADATPTTPSADAAYLVIMAIVGAAALAAAVWIAGAGR